MKNKDPTGQQMVPKIPTSLKPCLQNSQSISNHTISAPPNLWGKIELNQTKWPKVKCGDYRKGAKKSWVEIGSKKKKLSSGLYGGSKQTKASVSIVIGDEVCRVRQQKGD